MGHSTPSHGTSKKICTSITTLLNSQFWNLDNEICVRCDGTATNTDWKGRVVLENIRDMSENKWRIVEIKEFCFFGAVTGNFA